MANNVLYASTIIMSDPTTRNRVAMAVNNHAWSLLLQLGATPPQKTPEGEAFSKKLVNNPGFMTDQFLWALSSYTDIAQKVLTAYGAAGGSPDIGQLLRDNITDDDVRAVIDATWPILSEQA